MYRKNKEELVILKISNDCQFLRYSEIRKFFLCEMRQFLYLIDDDERLVGILSIGDVKRREKAYDKVKFNLNFSRLYEWNVISAKKIFDQNKKILEIPVLDGDDRIVGAYARKDDFLEIKFWEKYIEGYKDVIIGKLKLSIHIIDSQYRDAVNSALNIFTKIDVPCEVVPVKNLEFVSEGGGIICSLPKKKNAHSYVGMWGLRKKRWRILLRCKSS